MGDMKINFSAASASESIQSDFMSMSSRKSRSSSGNGRNQSRSPRSLGNESASSPACNFLTINKNSSSNGSTYHTPEYRNETICDSARNQPKFQIYGDQAPRKGGFISDSDSCSSSSARKPKRAAARPANDRSNGKVKAFRLDASDVESSSENETDQQAQSSPLQSNFGNFNLDYSMQAVSIGNSLATASISPKPIRI